jgi:pantoate--beta-alanine ligase
MKLIYKASELSQATSSARRAGKFIGFVPTMGALHEGHLSLMHFCRDQNDVAIASIFVNPTQFNDSNDLRNYPRMPDKDIAMLKGEGCDIVFLPDENEMYPVPDTRLFDFGGLENYMEGRHRPGHFNGVAQVVTRLFDIVMPHRAYFGLKDFQQLAIVKKFVSDLRYPVEIIPCPIVRESDGLAMSSRNMRLNAEQRTHAALISQTLFQAKEMAGKAPVAAIRNFVTDRINADPFLETEYFEIVHGITLKPVGSWDEPGEKVGCIAVNVGQVRLIDNVVFSS